MVVRYGYEGGGAGQEGRWEVAMLERNGLRHGGFGLRENMEVWKNGMVKTMAWNADSEILAIWIERQKEDVSESSMCHRNRNRLNRFLVQLWSMKNYHYYLKQEIHPMKPKGSKFSNFRWHPEEPLTLYIAGESTCR